MANSCLYSSLQKVWVSICYNFWFEKKQMVIASRWDKEKHSYGPLLYIPQTVQIQLSFHEME